MRKLASLRKIDSIEPIEGADAIECANVGGWKVVVKKGEFQEGQMAIYCEIDSWIPHELAPFLSKGQPPREYNGIKGERLRTVKLRGQISQGLLLPLSILEGEEEMKIGTSMQSWGPQLQLGPYDDALVIEEGADVTELLGIQKWEAPIPAQLAGQVKGNFPSFVPKTDEERVQNIRFDKIRSEDTIELIASEKLEGTSITVYLDGEGNFGVCSRNNDLVETERNTYWKAVRDLNLESKMRDYCSYYWSLPAQDQSEGQIVGIVLQGELIGEGIQGNYYGIKGHQIYFFTGYTLYSEGGAKCVDPDFLESFCNHYDLNIAPKITGQVFYIYPPKIDFETNQTIIQSFLDLAENHMEGKSWINPSVMKEGIVFRSRDKKVSFKAISNKYLLKQK